MVSNEERIEFLENTLKKVMIFIDKSQSRILQLTEEIDKLKQTKGVTMSNTVETTQAPQQWEYMRVDVAGRSMEKLNKLGAEGWQIAEGEKLGNSTTVFVRPKPQKKTPDQGYSGYER